ncbi:MAG: hypothetical protein WBF33_04915 [Candidatus Nitrosopolaris sp.]
MPSGQISTTYNIINHATKQLVVLNNKLLDSIMDQNFFDRISEALFDEIPKPRSRVLLNIERFEIGQS